MNMTERDWEIVLAEQREAFHALADSPKEPAPTVGEYMDSMTKPLQRARPMTPAKFHEQYSQQPNPSKEPQIFRFIRVEKTTAKAKFFVTHEDMAEIHGFWCPNAAIILRDTDVVEVAHWCKIKIIEFK